ncbi:hypothetical protein ACYOEI_08845, partial [Singulisphaera rosea]
MSIDRDQGRFARGDRTGRYGSEFASEWRRGGRPRIEDMLGRVDEAERSSLLSVLIVTEATLRREGGESPTLEEYQTRFPALEIDSVESTFRNMGGA